MGKGKEECKNKKLKILISVFINEYFKSVTKSTSGNANLFSIFLKTLCFIDLMNKRFSNRFYQLLNIAIKLNNCIGITKYIWYIQNILLYLFFILRFYRMKYNTNVDIHTSNWTLQVMTKLSNSRLNFLRITKIQH